MNRPTHCHLADYCRLGRKWISGPTKRSARRTLPGQPVENDFNLITDNYNGHQRG